MTRAMTSDSGLPERPAILDTLGLRQAVMRTWIPILLVILVGAAMYLPLQSLSVESKSIKDTDLTHEYTLYQGHYQVDISGMDELIATDEENLSYMAGMKDSYSVSHGDGINHALQDSMDMDSGEIAEDHATNSWWLFLFSFLLLLLMLERSSDGWFNRNIPVALEWMAAVLALLVVIFAAIGLGTYFDLGDAAPEALGHSDQDGGLLGDVSSEESEGVPSETITWSPGLAMWLELLAMLIAIPLILLHLFEALSPGWWGESRSSNPRSLFKETDTTALHESDGLGQRNSDMVARIPAFAASLALLLVLSALFMPWVQHEQTYRVEDDDGDFSVHSVSWSAGLFSTSFTNSTMFDNATGVEATEQDTGDNASIGNTEELVGDLGLKVFLAMALIIIPLGMAMIPNDKRKNLGSSRIWLAACLLMSCWVLSGITESIQAGGDEIADDASTVIPHENLFIAFNNIQDGTMGYAIGFANLQGADWLSPIVEATWSTTWAVTFIHLATVLLFLTSLICLTGIHELASRSTGRFSAFPISLHGEPLHHGGWLATPEDGNNHLAFASVGVLLLLTALMGGTLTDSLVTSGSSSGPEGKSYLVDIMNSNDDEWADGTMNNGDVLKIDVDIPASFVGNATYLMFIAGCSDNLGDWGSNNPVGEDTDAIRIEIQLPDELGGDILVEEEDCVDNWSFEEEFGDPSSNRDQHVVQAASEEGAALRFYGDDTLMISTEVTITAITKGSLGGTGVNQDDELYAAVYSEWRGFYSVVEEIDEGE